MLSEIVKKIIESGRVSVNASDLAKLEINPADKKKAVMIINTIVEDQYIFQKQGPVGKSTLLNIRKHLEGVTITEALNRFPVTKPNALQVGSLFQELGDKNGAPVEFEQSGKEQEKLSEGPIEKIRAQVPLDGEGGGRFNLLAGEGTDDTAQTKAGQKALFYVKLATPLKQHSEINFREKVMPLFKDMLGGWYASYKGLQPWGAGRQGRSVGLGGTQSEGFYRHYLLSSRPGELDKVIREYVCSVEKLDGEGLEERVAILRAAFLLNQAPTHSFIPPSVPAEANGNGSLMRHAFTDAASNEKQAVEFGFSQSLCSVGGMEAAVQSAYSSYFHFKLRENGKNIEVLMANIEMGSFLENFKKILSEVIEEYKEIESVPLELMTKIFEKFPDFKKHCEGAAHDITRLATHYGLKLSEADGVTYLDKATMRCFDEVIESREIWAPLESKGGFIDHPVPTALDDLQKLQRIKERDEVQDLELTALMKGYFLKHFEGEGTFSWKKDKLTYQKDSGHARDFNDKEGGYRGSYSTECFVIGMHFIYKEYTESKKDRREFDPGNVFLRIKALQGDNDSIQAFVGYLLAPVCEKSPEMMRSLGNGFIGSINDYQMQEIKTKELLGLVDKACKYEPILNNEAIMLLRTTVGESLREVLGGLGHPEFEEHDYKYKEFIHRKKQLKNMVLSSLKEIDSEEQRLKNLIEDFKLFNTQSVTLMEMTALQNGMTAEELGERLESSSKVSLNRPVEAISVFDVCGLYIKKNEGQDKVEYIKVFMEELRNIMGRSKDPFKDPFNVGELLNPEGLDKVFQMTKFLRIKAKFAPIILKIIEESLNEGVEFVGLFDVLYRQSENLPAGFPHKEMFNAIVGRLAIQESSQELRQLDEEGFRISREGLVRKIGALVAKATAEAVAVVPEPEAAAEAEAEAKAAAEGAEPEPETTKTQAEAEPAAGAEPEAEAKATAEAEPEAAPEPESAAEAARAAAEGAAEEAAAEGAAASSFDPETQVIMYIPQEKTGKTEKTELAIRFFDLELAWKFYQEYPTDCGFARGTVYFNEDDLTRFNLNEIHAAVSKGRQPFDGYVLNLEDIKGSFEGLKTSEGREEIAEELLKKSVKIKTAGLKDEMKKDGIYANREKRATDKENFGKKSILTCGHDHYVSEGVENINVSEPIHLIGSGAYNPFHPGHLMILLDEALRLKQAGMSVGSINLVPDNQGYLEGKKAKKILKSQKAGNKEDESRAESRLLIPFKDRLKFVGAVVKLAKESKVFKEGYGDDLLRLIEVSDVCEGDFIDHPKLAGEIHLKNAINVVGWDCYGKMTRQAGKGIVNHAGYGGHLNTAAIAPKKEKGDAVRSSKLMEGKLEEMEAAKAEANSLLPGYLDKLNKALAAATGASSAAADSASEKAAAQAAAVAVAAGASPEPEPEAEAADSASEKEAVQARAEAAEAAEALAAVAQDGMALEYVDRIFMSPEDYYAVARAAVEQKGEALRFVRKVFGGDRAIVLAAVRQDGYALEHASLALRDDREVVLTAVAKNGRALEHASARLQCDSDVLLVAKEQKELASHVVRGKPSALFAAPAAEAVRTAAEAVGAAGSASPEPRM